MENNKIVLFEGSKIRRVMEKGEWWFVIEDIVRVLTETINPKDYFNKILRRDEELSKGYGQIVHTLWVLTSGGRQKMNCASTAGILRIIQSIPSPKAEPFKIWLAKVGYERLQETVDPERSINRARQNWQKLGRPEKWIQQRMMSQETRNKLTDYWKDHGVKEGNEFALLTNVIHQEWTGLTVGQHKKLKDLKTENLRDHMSEAELIFTALAEYSTREIANKDRAEGLPENVVAGKKGGNIAKKARLELEEKTGKKIVTGNNFKLALKDFGGNLKLPLQGVDKNSRK